MDLEKTMKEKSFAVVGDTLNEKKYACIIKNKLLDNNYKVFSVGKELKSLNDINDDIDIIVLCINSKEGLRLMKECKKSFKNIVIQPGAESEELIDYLKEKDYPFINGCILVGLSLYKK